MIKLPIVGVIAAVDLCWGMGNKGQLPWGKSVKGDLKRFKVITTAGEKPAVVMGRKTWESMGSKPLPDRVNIVLSSKVSPHSPDVGIHYVESIEDALTAAVQLGCDRIWGIGGRDIYMEMLGVASIVDLTIIPDVFESDVLFPSEALAVQKWVRAQPMAQDIDVVYDGLSVEFMTLRLNTSPITVKGFIEGL